MEALRFRKNDPVDDCQGALIWSYSDCWGETGWSIIDYYLRRKASYYWFRRACTPVVKVIVRQRGEVLVMLLVNDTLQPVTGEVEGRLVAHSMAARARRSPLPPPRRRAEQHGRDRRRPAARQRDAERDPTQWVYAAVLPRPRRRPRADQNLWDTVAPAPRAGTWPPPP